MHVNFKLLDRIPPWRVSPGIINFSPRLKLDEILTTNSVGRVPSRGALSSDLRPLTSGGVV
jgi:hypothetical protein